MSLRTIKCLQVMAPAVLLGLLLEPTAAAVIRVGAAPECTVSSLEAAVILASSTVESDEIRLNYGEGTLYDDTAITLTDFGNGARGALSFVGGFGGCTDDTAASTPVVVRGTAGAPVFTLNTSTSDSIVTFRNLTLRDSGTNGLVIGGNSTVTMDNARSLSHGGSGVRITSGASLELLGVSRIENNTTSGFGGGIFCQDSTVNIMAASIGNNAADSGGGGGIYASNCDLDIARSGFLSGNTAIDGAGIYADRGSTVTIQGDADGRPAVNVNAASDDGGAIYAKNAGTSVVVYNGRFDGNDAVSRGGALFIGEGATLLMNATERSCRVPTAPPGVRDDCSTMLGNTLAAGGLGVALYVDQGATAVVARTYLEGNEGGDSLIHALDADTAVFLEGLSVWDNPVTVLQDVRDGAHLSSSFVSSARNLRDVMGSPVDADVLQVSGATAEMYSSVYAGGSFLGTSGLSGRCVMGSIATPLVDGIDFFTLESSPGFVDPDNGNLRLSAASPALDYCDDSGYSPLWNDIDLQARGVDLQVNPDGSPGVPGGLFDLGFDELVDSLFADRFES